MTFEEKSTWLILVTMTLVYGWYFATVAGQLGGTDVGDIDYQGLMLTTVGLVVALAVVGIILITVAGRGDDSKDERDKTINRYGEYIGGFVLTAGALGGMLLAMIELEHFWVANTLLAGLVLSEIASNITKLVLYRRGVVSW